VVNASRLRVGPIRTAEASSQPLSSPRDSALTIPANKSCLSQSRGNFKFSYSGYWFSSLPFHEINKFPAKIIIIEAESPDVFLASIVHQKKTASVVQSRWTDLIQYSDLPRDWSSRFEKRLPPRWPVLFHEWVLAQFHKNRLFKL